MLEKYARFFKKLGNTAHPHKACLLLAVMELAERRHLLENKIFYEAPLIESFKRFRKVAKTGFPADLETAFYPMLHLETSGFWHLQHKPGRKSELDRFRHRKSLPERSHRFVRENVAYAKLDDDLYELLLDDNSRAELRKVLTDAWMKNDQNDINHAVQRMKEEAEYEHRLIKATLEGALCAKKGIPKKAVRKPVFRRLVLEAYGHRCAATGWRFLMPDGTSLIEAAHLRPFSESHDDRTVNGIALAPNIHRAMDRHLIAPGPDFKWHVSKTLDRTISGHLPLLDLKGKEIKEVEKIYQPDKHALEWRLNQLHDMDQQRK